MRRRRNNKRKKKTIKNKIAIITICSIFLILLIFSVIFSLINIGNEKIINGVKIEKNDISNMTKEAPDSRKKTDTQARLFWREIRDLPAFQRLSRQERVQSPWTNPPFHGIITTYLMKLWRTICPFLFFPD